LLATSHPPLATSSLTPLFPLHTQKQGGRGVPNSSNSMNSSSLPTRHSNTGGSNRQEISSPHRKLSTVNREP